MRRGEGGGLSAPAFCAHFPFLYTPLNVASLPFPIPSRVPPGLRRLRGIRPRAVRREDLSRRRIFTATRSSGSPRPPPPRLAKTMPRRDVVSRWQLEIWAPGISPAHARSHTPRDHCCFRRISTPQPKESLADAIRRFSRRG